MTSVTRTGVLAGNESVLDAAIELLEVRRRALSRLQRGERGRGEEVVASGDDLDAWMMRDARTWTRVLSTRPLTTEDSLRRSLPNNRRLVADGLRMTSVFDSHGTEAGARSLLESETGHGTYHFGSAPVRMRLVDGRKVYLSATPDAILSLTHPASVAAALRYWRAVMATATPCRAAPPPDTVLTSRQHLVLELLIRGVHDEEVARTIGWSVRTVRMEIAAAMAAYHVSSRVALGSAHARHTSVDRDAPGPVRP